MSKRNQQLTPEKAAELLVDVRETLADNRYILAVDFEATCDSDRSRLPRNESEIIEVGAVMIDTHTGDELFRFCRFIRPQIHPVLSDFCRELTSITQADVDAAGTFNEVVKELDEAIANALTFVEDGNSFAWVSWGQYDFNQYHAEVAKNAPKSPNYLSAADHINIKAVDGAQLSIRPRGLGSATTGRGLIWQGRAHRGIDDAINLSNVVLNIMETL